jgi:hypothetical protein
MGRFATCPLQRMEITRQIIMAGPSSGRRPGHPLPVCAHVVVPQPPATLPATTCPLQCLGRRRRKQKAQPVNLRLVAKPAMWNLKVAGCASAKATMRRSSGDASGKTPRKNASDAPVSIKLPPGKVGHPRKRVLRSRQ